MTENEAKEWIEYLGNKPLPYDKSPISRKLACDMAIKAIEENQAYRAIGTVEELEVLNRIAEETAEYVKKDKKILETYQRIGTIEEFRALKEKSADIEKIIESIKQLPTQDFMGVLHIPRTATITRIKRGGNCELPEV